MKTKMIIRFIQTLLSIGGLVIGAYLINNTIINLTAQYHSSLLFSAFFGVSLIIYVIGQNILFIKKKKAARWLLLSFIAFLIVFIKVETAIYSASQQKAEEGDALIVLGAGLSGENPGPLLRIRLNVAYEFLLENPNMVCVVSGGQGSDEIISEAEVMARYLIGKGIDTKRILCENKSTRTIENFAYSKIILDEYFQGEPYRLVFVTNTFHVYRAGLIAEKLSLSVQGLAAPTISNVQVNFYLREFCSLIYFWLFD